MKKDIILITALLISVSITGCAGKKAAVQNEIKQVQTQSAGNNDKTPAATETNKTDEAPNTVVSPADYSKYSGRWVTENNLKHDIPFGTVISIKADKSGQLSGVVSDTSSGFGHISNIDIKGKINNNKFSTNFSNDGWDHSGTIELEFKDMQVVLKLSYDKKSESVNSSWGISPGTFNLVNINIPIKRTINDLREGGWKDVEGQCFDVDLNKYGKIKFISETNWNTGFNFYLQDSKGNIAYKFPDLYLNDYQTKNYAIESISAVSFTDINNDSLKDVIILYKATDVTKKVQAAICNVFTQKSDGTFVNNSSLNDKINASGSTKDIASIVKFIKGIK